MSYELIEWIYAAYGGNAEAGADFLGSQGDIWDAQKDMLMGHAGRSRLHRDLSRSPRPIRTGKSVQYRLSLGYEG